MALQRNPGVIFLSFFMAARCFDESCGLVYRVGDSVWSIPPYPHYYSDWSSTHLFSMGDSLVFDFKTEFSNLVQVTPLEYQYCTANSPIKILNSGPATILLMEAGVFYFLCNLSNYCDLGQKISIIVQYSHASSPPPSPSPSPSPSPLPVTPTVLSPEEPPYAAVGNRNRSESPPMPARSDQAPSTSAGFEHTNVSTSNSCSGLVEFSLVGYCLVDMGISFSFWVLFGRYWI